MSRPPLGNSPGSILVSAVERWLIDWIKGFGYDALGGYLWGFSVKRRGVRPHIEDI